MTAIDLQAQRSDTTDFPATRLRAITPNDATELQYVPKALYIGGAGNVSILAQEDSAPVTLTAVPSGTIIPVRARIVRSTGTTATNIVALI
jgi:hypothetical protein